MERQDLEKLTFPELKKEMLKYGLQPVSSRARCIDLLMDYLDVNAPHVLNDPEELRASDNISRIPVKQSCLVP